MKYSCLLNQSGRKIWTALCIFLFQGSTETKSSEGGDKFVVDIENVEEDYDLSKDAPSDSTESIFLGTQRPDIKPFRPIIPKPNESNTIQSGSGSQAVDETDGPQGWPSFRKALSEAKSSLAKENRRKDRQERHPRDQWQEQFIQTIQQKGLTTQQQQSLTTQQQKQQGLVTQQEVEDLTSQWQKSGLITEQQQLSLVTQMQQQDHTSQQQTSQTTPQQKQQYLSTQQLQNLIVRWQQMGVTTEQQEVYLATILKQAQEQRLRHKAQQLLGVTTQQQLDPTIQQQQSGLTTLQHQYGLTTQQQLDPTIQLQQSGLTTLNEQRLKKGLTAQQQLQDLNPGDRQIFVRKKQPHLRKELEQPLSLTSHQWELLGLTAQQQQQLHLMTQQREQQTPTTKQQEGLTIQEQQQLGLTKQQLLGLAAPHQRQAAQTTRAAVHMYLRAFNSKEYLETWNNLAISLGVSGRTSSSGDGIGSKPQKVKSQDRTSSKSLKRKKESEGTQNLKSSKQDDQSAPVSVWTKSPQKDSQLHPVYFFHSYSKDPQTHLTVIKHVDPKKTSPQGAQVPPALTPYELDDSLRRGPVRGGPPMLEHEGINDASGSESTHCPSMSVPGRVTTPKQKSKSRTSGAKDLKGKNKGPVTGIVLPGGMHCSLQDGAVVGLTFPGDMQCEVESEEESGVMAVTGTDSGNKFGVRIEPVEAARDADMPRTPDRGRAFKGGAQCRIQDGTLKWSDKSKDKSGIKVPVDTNNRDLEQHNFLEQKRRSELRVLFRELFDVLSPEKGSRQTKYRHQPNGMARGRILDQAVLEIRDLDNLHIELLEEKVMQTIRQRKLKDRLLRLGHYPGLDQLEAEVSGVLLLSFQGNLIENFNTLYLALPAKNIKVINSFYKGMHDMQRCLRL